MVNSRRLSSLAAVALLAAASPAAARSSLDVEVTLASEASPVRVSIAGDTGERGRAHLAAAIARGERCASRPPRRATRASAAIRDGRFGRTLQVPVGDRARDALRAGNAKVCAWQLAAKHRPTRVLAVGDAQLENGRGMAGWALILLLGIVALIGRRVLKLLPTALALLIAHRLFKRRRRSRSPKPSAPGGKPTCVGAADAAGVEDLAARSARGHSAELAVSERLRPLVDEGWSLFEGFFPDGARGDVDHYLRGPASGWVIETKSFARIRKADLEQAARAADAVAALEQRPVHAVLCLAAGLPSHLEGRRQALGRDVFVVTVETIANKLRAWDAGCASRATIPVEHDLATAATAAPAEPSTPAAPEPAAQPTGPMPFAVEATLDFESLQMGDYRLN